MAHWTLDETSGTFADTSGNSNTGTQIGGVSYNQIGPVNRAAGFGSGVEYIQVPHNASLNPTQDITISFWVYTNVDWNTQADDVWRLMDKKQTALDTSPGWYLAVNGYIGESLQIVLGDGTLSSSLASGGLAWDTGRWYHIAFVFQASSATGLWYRDGVLVNTATDVFLTPNWGTQNLRIGSDTFNDSLNGRMDDVRVYNRMLNLTEVQQLYNLGLANRTAVVPSGLIGHWRLDETSGTVAADSSGNGRHGTYSVDASVMSVPGMVGRGCRTGGVVTIPDNDDFDVVPGQIMTIAFWLYNAPGSGTPIEKRTSGPYRGYTLQQDGVPNRLQGRHFIGDGNNVFGPNLSARFGTWSHVTCTIDAVANTFGCYRDGANYISRSLVGDTSNSAPLELCNIGGNAMMDDVRIYRRVLTVSEIQEIMAAQDGIRYNSNHRKMEYFDGNRHVSMTPPWPDVTDGLVGHWKLDETTGTTAADSSGNGLAGTMVNGLNGGSSTYGTVGRALTFNSGAANGITFGQNSSLDFSPGNQFTFSAWAYPNDATTGGSIFSRGNYNSSADTFSYNLGGYGSGPRWYARISDGVSILTVLSPNGTKVPSVWAHVVVTWDGTDLKLYKDAVEVGASNSPGFTLWEPTTLVRRETGIGYDVYQNDDGFGGKIDDVRVYDRPLSQDEIQRLYAMGAPVGQTTALPQGCAAVGQVCDDGTIYAGFYNGNNYFTTPSDAGSLPMNNANGSGLVDVSTANSDVDGLANSNIITVRDSDSISAGFQPHQAAQYCVNLEAHGASDWYLAARVELASTLCTNRALIPGMSSLYWSSSDHATAGYFQQVSSTCTYSGVLADQLRAVRCVRKGPAPRCANPYGLEGSLLYHATYGVMQYCDGARWIAIGKSGP